MRKTDNVAVCVACSALGRVAVVFAGLRCAAPRQQWIRGSRRRHWRARPSGRVQGPRHRSQGGSTS